MLSNSTAYQAEIRYHRQQLDADLARRQQIKQAKLARRSRNHSARGPIRRLFGA